MKGRRVRLECYAYMPYTTNAQLQPNEDRSDRQLLFAMKDGSRYWLAKERKHVDPYVHFVRRLSRAYHRLERSAVLVPIPRHTITPRDPRSEPWAALAIADQLVKAGLADRVEIALRRVKAVPSSHMAKRAGAARPTVTAHLESMEAEAWLLMGEEPVVLVDDVITNGTQAVACEQLLRADGYPGTITAFAAAYTVGGDDLRINDRLGHTIWEPGTGYPKMDWAPF